MKAPVPRQAYNSKSKQGGAAQGGVRKNSQLSSKDEKQNLENLTTEKKRNARPPLASNHTERQSLNVLREASLLDSPKNLKTFDEYMKKVD